MCLGYHSNIRHLFLSNSTKKTRQYEFVLNCFFVLRSSYLYERNGVDGIRHFVRFLGMFNSILLENYQTSEWCQKSICCRANLLKLNGERKYYCPVCSDIVLLPHVHPVKGPLRIADLRRPSQLLVPLTQNDSESVSFIYFGLTLFYFRWDESFWYFSTNQ